MTHVSRRLRAERSSEDISDGAYAVLAALCDRGPKTVTALAADQYVRPPTITRTVNPLVESGLVRRDANPADGRHTILSITPEGAARIARTRRRRTEWLAMRLSTLDRDERELLARAALLLASISSTEPTVDAAGGAGDR